NCFTSGRCLFDRHFLPPLDTMLLPQSKRNRLWSINTTSKRKKEIFLFSERVLPHGFPIAAWLVGLLYLPQRQRLCGVCLRLSLPLPLPLCLVRAFSL
uniref:Uncharacterized protein n=1 Tax=Ursus maritimus TaxID=29073 RepID=A0A452VG48_URSMA